LSNNALKTAPGPYIKQEGYLGYNEVQQFLSYMVSSLYTQT